jgi:hypothetical protein
VQKSLRGGFFQILLCFQGLLFALIVCFRGRTYKWEEGRDYLWPIPTDQRVATGGALSQNPGYEDGLSF